MDTFSLFTTFCSPICVEGWGRKIDNMCYRLLLEMHVGPLVDRVIGP